MKSDKNGVQIERKNTLMETKFTSVAISYDNDKKPIAMQEIKTLTESGLKDLKKQVESNKREKQEKLDKLEQEKQEKETKLYSRLDKLSILLAYLMFNEIVERGKANTTNEFEDMFACWLVGKCEIAVELCPKEYLDILERLGVENGRD